MSDSFSVSSVCSVVYQYPESAKFGRVLPKNKIYEHGSPSSAVKQLFIRQVEQITWLYKLAPETINIRGTQSVPEIQVFGVALKDGELKTEVRRCIDQAIPFPILFELKYDGRLKSVAAFKRPNETDSAKWVISEYFESGWISMNTPRKSLPIVFDLETLYGHLLTPLMPHPARPDENLQAWVERMELSCSRQRELEKCEARLRKEKQFNRRVMINAELRNLRQDLEGLIQ